MNDLRAALEALLRTGRGFPKWAEEDARDALTAVPVPESPSVWANRIREDEAKRHDLYHELIAEGLSDDEARGEAWPYDFDPLTEGGPSEGSET